MFASLKAQYNQGRVELEQLQTGLHQVGNVLVGTSMQ